MRRLFAVVLACCGGAGASPDATATLSGTVQEYQGSCMPIPPPGSCVVTTPSRAVYLYPVQYFDESSGVFPTSVDAAPVAQTTSDDQGHYTMRAPPGRWSLFVEDEGHLYANVWDSTDDAIDPVNLAAGVETTRDVMIDHATW